MKLENIKTVELNKVVEGPAIITLKDNKTIILEKGETLVTPKTSLIVSNGSVVAINDKINIGDLIHFPSPNYGNQMLNPYFKIS